MKERDKLPEKVENLDGMETGLAVKIGVAAIFRIVFNTARRFTYPFAPALSRGLGVPVTSVTSIIAVNQAAGLLGTFLGPVSDRLGYRAMMLAGLGLLTTGMLGCGFFPYYFVVMAALFLAGLAKSIFDPAFQAFVGERVPYKKRGLVIGLTEFSWAASSLIGIPVAGILIDRLGWRSPFFVLGIIGLTGIISLFFMIPSDKYRVIKSEGADGYFKALRKLAESRASLGTLGLIFFISMANDNLFVVYGLWLEKEFGLSIIAIGIGTTVIGVAEFAGEALTALLSDKFGLRRSIAAGLLFSSVSYLLFPLFGKNLSFALAGLFMVFLFFEFAIVCSISLCTEILPGARATMMSGYLAASGLGRMTGALIGGPVWLAGGLPATGVVAAAVSLLALFSFVWG
ncbi:MAG: MFS transporter, partial [Desulfobacteraceae bacterium]